MLNVLPDFFAPGTMEIASIKVNGIPRASFSPSNYQIELDDDELGRRSWLNSALSGEEEHGTPAAGRQKNRRAGGE